MVKRNLNSPRDTTRAQCAILLRRQFFWEGTTESAHASSLGDSIGVEMAIIKGLL